MNEELDAKFEEFMKQSLSTSSSEGEETKQKMKEKEEKEEKKEKGKKNEKEGLWWLKGETNKPTEWSFLKPTQTKKTGETNKEHERKENYQTGSGNSNKPEMTTRHMKTAVTEEEKEEEEKEEAAVSRREEEEDDTENVFTLGTETSEAIERELGGLGSSTYDEDFESELKMTETEDDGDQTVIGSSSSIIPPPPSLGDVFLLSEEHKTLADETTDTRITSRADRKQSTKNDLVAPAALSLINDFNVRTVDEILREADELEKSLSRLEGGGGGGRSAEGREETERRLSITNKTPSASPTDVKQLLQDETRRNAKLSGDIQRQKVEFEERTFQIEEENMQLKARLEGIRNEKMKAPSDGNEEETEERLKERFNRQAKEQERLLVGYQKENERLFKEVKEMRNAVKETSEKAQEETRYLRRELARTKEEMDYKDVLLKGRGGGGGERDGDVDTLKSTREQLDAQKMINERLTKKLSQIEENEEQFNEAIKFKKRIVALEREVRDKNVENRSLSAVVKTKERKVEQLQKQVKQLENLLHVRNPNSIAALVLAAGVADGNATDADGSPRIVTLLEERIRDLESKLGTQTTEGSKSFEALQEQFNLIKDQYRMRVEELERQLAARSDSKKPIQQGGGGSSRPQTTITALEMELESVRERHRREVDKLRGELDAVQKEMKRKNAGGFKDGGGVLNSRIRSLVSEGNAKDRIIEELKKKVKEKEENLVKDQGADPRTSKKVGYTTSELERLRHELRVVSVRAEESFQGFKESETTFNGLVTELRSELALTNSNLKKSTLRFLEASRKCETQEIIIDDLKEKLSDMSRREEKMESLKAENGTLRVRCRQLQEEVCRVRTVQDPKLEDFMSLQARVLEVERMYREKSEELRRITSGKGRQNVTPPPITNETTEVNKWKRKFYARNVELERFRSELDEIILALEELQQGIIS